MSRKSIVAFIAMFATSLPVCAVTAFAQGGAATITIHADQAGPHVAREVFSQFAEHLGTGVYGGIWVGENSPIPNIRGYRKDVVEALKELQVPLIRWPGGCYADQYHWRDAIGPAEKRVIRFRRGGNDSNAFGTHEFMGFLDLIGSKAFLSANVGNAIPQETADWLEYMTGPAGTTIANERVANGHPEPWQVPYLGIGNELWGCGGNMRAEYAADIVRQYTTFLRGRSLMRIAAGADRADYHWTETMMKEAGKQIDGLSVHFYTYLHHAEHESVGVGFGEKGVAIGFDEQEWADTLAYTFGMDELIAKNKAIMDQYDPAKRVFISVDEWGSWYKPDGVHPAQSLYQENTVRDALIAAINLNIFVKHADRVKLTAIAQMVNVLQAMLLTDGAKMVKTPTYWVYDMYKPWQDATSLPIEVNAPEYVKGSAKMPGITASAVRDAKGKIHVALSNQNPNAPATVVLKMSGSTGATISGKTLTAPALDSRNTFDHPDAVKPVDFKDFRKQGNEISITLPAKSVTVLDI